MTAYLNGFGVCLPNAAVSNEQIERVLGQVGGRTSRMKEVILARNGIQTRHYAIDPTTGLPTHNNAELTAEAIGQLMDGCSLKPIDIELLACGTSSPDQWIPNHAAMVQGLLQWPPCEIVSTAGVCCSGMTALRYATNAVQAGITNAAVVTGSELASGSLKAAHFRHQVESRVDQNPFLSFENEFLRWMLSDGAGAVLVQSQPRTSGLSLRLDWLDIVSYAGDLESCMYAGAVKRSDGSLKSWREAGDPNSLLREGYFNLSQDARVLERNIIQIAFRRSLEWMLSRRKTDPSSIDWLLPHMSSEFFRQPIAATMQELGFEVPQEKWFTNLSRKGNTGSASIFIMLEELFHSGLLRPNQRLICVVPESARFSFAYASLTVVDATLVSRH
jgi:3-oxoacyl-[acyl-carrier-protein] synthase III